MSAIASSEHIQQKAVSYQLFAMDNFIKLTRR